MARQFGWPQDAFYVGAFALSFQCSLSLTAMTDFGDCDFGTRRRGEVPGRVGSLSKFCELCPVASYKSSGHTPRAPKPESRLCGLNGRFLRGGRLHAAYDRLQRFEGSWMMPFQVTGDLLIIEQTVEIGARHCERENVGSV